MAAKTIKTRRYPNLTLSQIKFIEAKRLQVKEIVVLKDVKCDTDISIGSEHSSVWLTNILIKDDSYEALLQQNESEFVEMLMLEDFSDSVRNDCTRYLSKLRKGGKHKNDINAWVEKLYLTHQDNIAFIIQLFRLMRCFSFQYFYPSSLILANLGVHHVSDHVKSEALSLLDHWGNAEIFDLLKYHEPPETPWLRAKYLSIRESLERYAVIQKNRRNTVVR